MECRESQTLLTAFHDGELPVADRARVEEHLRGCRECGERLDDLARADQAAGVPDPGPAYWDRFNARVMDRVDREADGPGVAILRPKRGWMRQQLRYLVPAAAAAALVVVVARYGGMGPGAPTTARDGQVPGQAGMPPVLQSRPTVSEPAAPLSAEQRTAKAEPGSDGQGRPSAGTGRDTTGSVVRADRPLSEAKERASRDRAAAPAAIGEPSPPVTAADGVPAGMQAERNKMAEQQAGGKAESASGMRMPTEQAAEAPPAAPLGKTRPKAGPASLASAPPPAPAASPCEPARTLAGRKRFREAEVAQRACLAGGPDAPFREKGLVFLAELLDRQARFAEADAVIAEVDRQFPRSRPLDLYRRQRPMVQQQPMEVPVTR